MRITNYCVDYLMILLKISQLPLSKWLFFCSWNIIQELWSRNLSEKWKSRFFSPHTTESWVELRLVRNWYIIKLRSTEHIRIKNKIEIKKTKRLELNPIPFCWLRDFTEMIADSFTTLFDFTHWTQMIFKLL